MTRTSAWPDGGGAIRSCSTTPCSCALVPTPAAVYAWFGSTVNRQLSAGGDEPGAPCGRIDTAYGPGAIRRYGLTSPYPTSESQNVVVPPANAVRYTSTLIVSGDRCAPRISALAGAADAAGAASAPVGTARQTAATAQASRARGSACMMFPPCGDPF